MTEPATPNLEDRIRKADWFKPYQRGGEHLSVGTGSARSPFWGPVMYIVGVVGLPVAFVLFATNPFGWPEWAYGALVFLAGTPGWSLVQSWSQDIGISSYSPKAAAAQAWLYLGGALPQAIRALRSRP